MKRTVLTALAMLTLAWSTVPAGADDVSPDCVAAASLRFLAGNGAYTTSPPPVVVPNPEAPAYVLFRLRLQRPTCPEVTYTLFVLDGPNGNELAQAEKVGGGTIISISYEIPFDEDLLPKHVCVYSEVTIDEELVSPPAGRRTASTCLVLPLNTTTPPADEFW